MPPSASAARDCGPLRPSRRGRWRACALIFVHVLVAIHIWHWKTTGRTLTPVEPSEAMETLSRGYINAGFILFLLLIIGTLVLGRFFCGWGCHIVALQDLCTWMLRRVGIRPRPFRSRLLVYVPILAALYMFVLPSVVRVIMGHPAPDWQLHLVTDNFWERFPAWLVASITFLVCGFVTVYLLGNKGFCTYACPYGGIFGLADKVAPGRIRVTDACEGCGHCTATCTSNVRVHEEVKHYKMVVDSGCMKCLDCVSVCPKDALYFGFATPLLAKAKSQLAPPKRRYDYSWKEEGVLAATFLFSMFSLTALYSSVPLLLALGASALSSYVVICAVQFFQGGDVTFARKRLRRAGAPTTTAYLFVVGFLLWMVFLAHSSIVQYLTLHGNWDYNRSTAALATFPGDDGVRSTLQKATERLHLSARLSLVPTAVTHGRLAMAYALLGDHQQAEAMYRRAGELARDFPDAHFQLATYANQRQEVDVVIAELTEVLRTHPSYPGAHQALAEALIAQGRQGEAVTMLRELVERAPGDSEIQLTLAVSLAVQGHADAALRLTDDIVQREPRNAMAHVRRGQALSALERYRDALAAHETGAQLQPDLPLAQYTLGLIQLRLARSADALASLRRAVDLQPMQPTYVRAWSRIVERSGQLEQEITLAQQDRTSAGRFRLMHLYRLAGREEDARRLSLEGGWPEH